LPLEAKTDILLGMQNIISYADFYVKDGLFSDNNVSCTRVHINVIQKKPQPYNDSGVYIWLDGELYNQAELSPADHGVSDPELIAKLYRNSKDFSFLKKVDGIYSAVIYDSVKSKVYILSDRYGLRHIYWGFLNNSLVWSSEVKAFLKLRDFSPRINGASIKDFFSAGFLLEDRTWFEGVKLLPSGTVLTYDLRTKEVSTDRYWWWDNIKTISGECREDEITEELERLFRNAVGLRCRANEKIGLTLSGGLDSRAILAALPKDASPGAAVTFGKKGCDDIKIASRAAKAKGIKHYIIEMNGKNWFLPRIEGVWWTDGQKNLRDMNGLAGLVKTRGMFEINLDGLAGDALIGGSYYFSKLWPSHELWDCRIRRFTVMGQIMREKYLQQRFPFYDNKFLEFALSIPAELKKRSYIYNKMLLRAFPALFRTIPWQTTGFPISYPPSVVRYANALMRIQDKCCNSIGLPKFSFYYSGNNHYFMDCRNWLLQEPAKSMVDMLLTGKNTLYGDFINRSDVINNWEAHQKGRDKSQLICLYATFEIWLRQVFRNEFKDKMIA